MRWVQSLVTDAERDVFSGSPGIGVLAVSGPAGASSGAEVLGSARTLPWTADLYDLAPDELPERLRLSVTTKGALALSLTTHAGADRAGRPGNVLTHVCVVAQDRGEVVSALRPAQTWGSDRWLRAQSARHAAGLALTDPGPDAAPGMAVAALWSFLHDAGGGRRADRLGEFFGCLEGALAGRLARIAVVEETAGDVARWVAVGTQVVSRSAAWAVTFSTYEDPSELNRLSTDETGMLVGLLSREVARTGVPPATLIFDPDRGVAGSASAASTGEHEPSVWEDFARSVWALESADCVAFFDEFDQILGEIVPHAGAALYQLPLCVLLGSDHGLDRASALVPALAWAPPETDPSSSLLTALLAALDAFGDPVELVDRASRVTGASWGVWAEALATVQLLSLVGGRGGRVPDLPRRWVPPLRTDRADLVAAAVSGAVTGSESSFLTVDPSAILRLGTVLGDAGVLSRLDPTTGARFGVLVEEQLEQARAMAAGSARDARGEHLPWDLVSLALPLFESRRGRDLPAWRPLTAADERWLGLRWTEPLRRRYPGLAQDAMLREVSAKGGDDRRLRAAIGALVAGLGSTGRSSLLDLRVRRLLGGRIPTPVELRQFSDAFPGAGDWEQLAVRCLVATSVSADYSWAVALTGEHAREMVEDLVRLHQRLREIITSPDVFRPPDDKQASVTRCAELREWDVWLVQVGDDHRVDPQPLRAQVRALAVATLLGCPAVGLADAAAVEWVSVDTSAEVVERGLQLLDGSEALTEEDRLRALVLAVGLTLTTAAQRGVSASLGSRGALGDDGPVPDPRGLPDTVAAVRLVNQIYGGRLRARAGTPSLDYFFDDLRHSLVGNASTQLSESAIDILEQGWTHHPIRDRLRRRSPKSDF